MQTNIQLLRFLAAMAVVLHHGLPHYLLAGGSPPFPVISTLANSGYAGVDVFFVISGYIMMVSTQGLHGPVATGQFLYRRLARIYLGYWPYFLLMLAIMAWFVPAHLERIDWPGSLFLTEHHPGQLLIPVSWTLKYELYFYLCFAVTLLLPARWRAPMLWATLLLVTACVALTLLLDKATLKQYAQWVIRGSRFYLSPYCAEFLAGCLLAQGTLTHGRHTAGLRRILAWAIAGLASVAWLVLCQQHLPDMHALLLQQAAHRVIVFGPLALSIVGLFVSLEAYGIRFFPRASLLLGASSYSLYLSHTILLTLLFHTGIRDGLPHWLPSPAWLRDACLLVIAALIVLYSIWHYRLIEAPLNRWAKKVLPTRH